MEEIKQFLQDKGYHDFECFERQATYTHSKFVIYGKQKYLIEVSYSSSSKKTYYLLMDISESKVLYKGKIKEKLLSKIC